MDHIFTANGRILDFDMFGLDYCRPIRTSSGKIKYMCGSKWCKHLHHYCKHTQYLEISPIVGSNIRIFWDYFCVVFDIRTVTCVIYEEYQHMAKWGNIKRSCHMYPHAMSLRKAIKNNKLYSVTSVYINKKKLGVTNPQYRILFNEDNHEVNVYKNTDYFQIYNSSHSYYFVML
jgi:hypothetical protein